jgi:RNA polymerase sigma-70 factor (ECF subfamily)
MPQRWTALADHIDAVRAYARMVGRDAVHADDLVQECLARALARPGDWRDVQDARAYLLTILHNLHVDEVARRWRDGVAVPIDDVDAPLACAPEQFGRLLVRDLARSLQVLPEERRRLLLLIALDGLSYRDAARLLGMPVGTVMSRLSRTRDALRRLMDEEESCNDDRRLAEGHRGGRGKEREGFNAAAAE